MKSLRAGLRNDNQVNLDEAALDIASIEYPDLDPQHYTGLLDTIARRIGRRLNPGSDGPSCVREISRYLFEDLALKGNESDYYDPRNSCLNDVLDRRLGIPITLSVIYMEVARRLGKTVNGIGLPGHFVIEYRDENYSTFLDPFHGGLELRIEQVWEPASQSQILTRMLNNLQGAYFRAGQYSKAAQALDMLIESDPAGSSYYRARGMAHLQLRQLLAANADFETYLKHNPDASDRVEITKQMEAIQRWMASVN